jgi:hypothetical protein
VRHAFVLGPPLAHSGAGRTLAAAYAGGAAGIHTPWVGESDADAIATRYSLRRLWGSFVHQQQDQDEVRIGGQVMSEESQGPGWWQASDLKWYPPENHPDSVASLPPPPGIDAPPEGQPQRRLLKWPLNAAMVVVLAAVGTIGYLVWPDPPQPPSARSGPASVHTVQAAAPSSAMVPSATAAPAAGASGVAPFLGQWGGGHSGGLVIRADGSGRWTYSDVSTCPDAPLAGCGITGTVDFTLASVANGTATGRVTGGSNHNNDPVGEPVIIVLGSANGKGVVLAVSISKMRGWNFCNDTSPNWCAEGAT